MKLKIATIQPKCNFKNDTPERLDQAEVYVNEAAAKGASIVCFPEHYPGPVQSAKDGGYPYRDRLCEIAKDNNVYLIAGAMERVGDTDKINLVELVISSSGTVIGKYIRTTPSGPYIYDAWDVNYHEGEGPLEVFDTEFGKIGVLVCSEMFPPELSRILALKGAEIIFYPVGGGLYDLKRSFQTIVKARAVENLLYAATCSNIFGVESGVGLIAGPEEVIAVSPKPGVLVAEIDLERIRWLRETDEVFGFPKQYKTLPGVLKWRRPDLYRKNYPNW